MGEEGGRTNRGTSAIAAVQRCAYCAANENEGCCCTIGQGLGSGAAGWERGDHEGRGVVDIARAMEQGMIHRTGTSA